MRAQSKDSSQNFVQGAINTFTSGIAKKSFFKGFLSRGSQSSSEPVDPVNKSVNIKGGARAGSLVNSTLPNMQNAGMSMINGGYKN